MLPGQMSEFGDKTEIDKREIKWCFLKFAGIDRVLFPPSHKKVQF
jgi:hypothetical protein